MRLSLLTLFMIVFGSCASDHGLTPIYEHVLFDEAPDIVVEPTVINFGSLNADGEIASEVVSITNIGNAALAIKDIKLSIDSRVFAITARPEKNEIKQLETVTFTVTYNPETYKADTNGIFISSNDPDERSVLVYISGLGEAPVINIEPEEFDFGSTLVGCESTTEVVLSNIGNVDLVVEQIDYFVTYPADLGIEDFESVYGALPWVLRPGDSYILEIFHHPNDSDLDYGVIDVYSNDPLDPVITANQIADSSYGTLIEETFEQAIVNSVDIMFIIDNSGSMGSKQAQLANNFDIFMNVFQLSGVDYHMGFITTDSYNMHGPLITTTTADPVSEVIQIIDDIGVAGNYTEKGIDFSYYALQVGYEFGPGSVFWRNNSKLILIYISDEDDQSSSITPAILKAYVISAKGSVNYVAAHAVAGDYPGGCVSNGGATEAYQYYTTVGLLNGAFLSICLDDWGTPLEFLANESILKSSFLLAETAVAETIYVEVDNVKTSEWTYDSTNNAVSFNSGHVPAAGSTIYIRYGSTPDCPTKKEL